MGESVSWQIALLMKQRYLPMKRFERSAPACADIRLRVRRFFGDQYLLINYFLKHQPPEINDS